MIKDRLFELISSSLEIDKNYIIEDANITTLCVLSEYLNKIDEVEKQKLIINQKEFNKDITEEAVFDYYGLTIDLKPLFKNNLNNTFIYKEKRQVLNVNTGIGFIGFPGRIGMPPEVGLLTLKKG